MQKKVIKSSMIGKDELFKVIALGEAVGLPVLLNGPAGVGKTQVLLEYGASLFNHINNEQERAEATRDKSFIIELNEGTRFAEIVGRLDLIEYKNGKQVRQADIVNAEFILINEVDKANSAVRNSMLSIMNEKCLMLGNEGGTVKCKWRTFTASCNEIPTDEVGNPFWDRFVLKYNVERVLPSQIMKIWQSLNNREVIIAIPEVDDMNEAFNNMDWGKMDKFKDVIFKFVSDRTLSYLPKIVCAIKCIWGYNDIMAITKTCELISPSQVQEVAKMIEDQRVISIKSKISSLNSIQEIDNLLQNLEEIKASFTELSKDKKIKSDIEDAKTMLTDILDKNRLYQQIVSAGRLSTKMVTDVVSDTEAAIDPQKPIISTETIYLPF